MISNIFRCLLGYLKWFSVTARQKYSEFLCTKSIKVVALEHILHTLNVFIVDFEYVSVG